MAIINYLNDELYDEIENEENEEELDEELDEEFKDEDSYFDDEEEFEEDESNEEYELEEFEDEDSGDDFSDEETQEIERQLNGATFVMKRENYPFLTDDEYKLYKSNNENALLLIKGENRLSKEEKEWLMNDFIKRNDKLVYYVANKKIQSKFLCDVQELSGAGFLGFSKAIKKFDPTQGAKFATFAYRCIDNEIKYRLRIEDKHYQNTTSSSKPKCYDKDGKPLNLEETLADPSLNPEELIQREGRNKCIRESLNSLSPREKYIMYVRFAFDSKNEMTQKEVAAAMKMSQANISKIEKTCLDKLKEVLKDLDN